MKENDISRGVSLNTLKALGLSTEKSQLSKEDDIPRGVSLNIFDFWIQIQDLLTGFMSERVIKQIDNYIDVYVKSCPNNFIGTWKEYTRVLVTIDLLNPLKRKMKFRKTGNDWLWINFKYENVLIFFLLHIRFVGTW